MSNILDQCFVGTETGFKLFAKLSADDTSRQRGREAERQNTAQIYYPSCLFNPLLHASAFGKIFKWNICSKYSIFHNIIKTIEI